MLELSTHFAERWAKRVGGECPDAEEVRRMIDDAVFAQKHRDLRTDKGKPIRIVALYWYEDEELNVIFKVDEKRKRVVTVLTQQLKGGKE